MKVISSPENFIGLPHPWIVVTHFGLETRNEFFKEFLSSGYKTSLPGTILNTCGNFLTDGEPAEYDYIHLTEWRLIACDAADYIILETGSSVEAACEFAMYAKTGKLYVVRGKETGAEKGYYDHLIEMLRVSELDKPMRLLYHMFALSGGEPDNEVSARSILRL